MPMNLITLAGIPLGALPIVVAFGGTNAHSPYVKKSMFAFDVNAYTCQHMQDMKDVPQFRCNIRYKLSQQRTLTKRDCIMRVHMKLLCFFVQLSVGHLVP